VLYALTIWQRTFLIRLLNENRRQIPEWEVGSYKAVWGPEMEVLIEKGVVHEYRGGVYEIDPLYWDYLKHNFESGTNELA
jgi:hypothetical protein